MVELIPGRLYKQSMAGVSTAMDEVLEYTYICCLGLTQANAVRFYSSQPLPDLRAFAERLGALSFTLVGTRDGDYHRFPEPPFAFKEYDTPCIEHLKGFELAADPKSDPKPNFFNINTMEVL